MNEHGDSALSPEARELLQVAGEATHPTEADQARVLQGLRARLAAPLAPTQASAPAPLPRPSRSSWKWWTAAGVGIGLTAAAGLLQLAGSGSGSPSPAPASSQEQQGPIRQPSKAPEPRRTDPGAVTSAAPAVPSASQKAPAPKDPTASSSTQADNHLAEEVALLSKATSALHSGRAQEALATLAEHQRRFPGGALSQQRHAARAQALCQLGRKAEARSELGRLPKSSPLAARTRQACGFEK